MVDFFYFDNLEEFDRDIYLYWDQGSIGGTHCANGWHLLIIACL